MSAATSPPARRLRAGRRDVRLAVGVGLVVLSVVLGGRVLASSGDRVAVWSLRESLAAGTTLHDDDVVAVPAAAGTVSAYVPQSSDVAGRTLARDVSAGELLPAAALADAPTTDRRLVTVPVDPLHAPPGLARGERVDVYVSAKDATATGQDGRAELPTLVLAGVLVADPGSVDSAGTSSQLGVVIDVGVADAGRAVAAARGGEVDLVRVGREP